MHSESCKQGIACALQSTIRQGKHKQNCWAQTAPRSDAISKAEVAFWCLNEVHTLFSPKGRVDAQPSDCWRSFEHHHRLQISCYSFEAKTVSCWSTFKAWSIM